MIQHTKKKKIMQNPSQTMKPTMVKRHEHFIKQSNKGLNKMLYFPFESLMNLQFIAQVVSTDNW